MFMQQNTSDPWSLTKIVSANSNNITSCWPPTNFFVMENNFGRTWRLQCSWQHKCYSKPFEKYTVTFMDAIKKNSTSTGWFRSVPLCLPSDDRVSVSHQRKFVQKSSTARRYWQVVRVHKFHRWCLFPISQQVSKCSQSCPNQYTTLENSMRRSHSNPSQQISSYSTNLHFAPRFPGLWHELELVTVGDRLRVIETRFRATLVSTTTRLSSPRSHTALASPTWPESRYLGWNVFKKHIELFIFWNNQKRWFHTWKDVLPFYF